MACINQLRIKLEFIALAQACPLDRLFQQEMQANCAAFVQRAGASLQRRRKNMIKEPSFFSLFALERHNAFFLSGLVKPQLYELSSYFLRQET